MEGYFQVGYVRKKHGFKGDVVVRITADDPSPYDDVDAFFLENQGKAIPIFIETSRGVKADESIVRFDGIEGEAAAQALVGSALWLPDALLPELKEDQFYYHELPGYTVVNSGIVVGMQLIKVLEYPAQDLFEIQVEGREQSVLIPVVDAFIERLDKPNRTLYLCAPEGLYSL